MRFSGMPPRYCLWRDGASVVDAFLCPTCGEVFYRTTGPPPHPFLRIEAMRCRQKGKVYLLTDLPANTLDMLTDVPRFNWGLPYEEMSEKILRYGLGLEAVE